MALLCKQWYIHYITNESNKGSRLVEGDTKKKAIKFWEDKYKQPNQKFSRIEFYKEVHK